MKCQELVELVTEYLDGALEGDTARELAAHLKACSDCTAYVEQMRLTIRLVKAAPGPVIAPAKRDELLGAFRHRQAG